MHIMHAKRFSVNRLSLLPYFISLVQQMVSMIYSITLLVALGRIIGKTKLLLAFNAVYYNCSCLCMESLVILMSMTASLLSELIKF